MFTDHYRSAHEPNVQDLTETAENVILGTLSESDIAAWLKARDRHLNLEVEASHPLGYLAPWLPKVFPEAMFVITIREPLRWLKSRLNYHYHKTPAEWQRYRDFIWGRHHQGYRKEEAILEELGLYSLDAYLTQYSEQYELLFAHLPADRTLLLRTEQLNESRGKLGSFLGLATATIVPKHENGLVTTSDVLELLPPDFVDQCILKRCGWMGVHLGS